MWTGCGSCESQVFGRRSAVGPRTANGFMFEQLETRTKKFEENPVLKLEQKVESRTKNHVEMLMNHNPQLVNFR
jgi:hypothetical protein